MFCNAGNNPPVLNTDVSTNFCVDQGTFINQDLSEYTSSIPPGGTTLIWSRSNDYTRTDVYLINSTVVSQHTYYAFFLDEVNNCASPVLSVSLIVKTKPEILTTTEKTS